MPPRSASPSSLLAIGAALAALAGCAPAIGDECTTSADCSQSGERLCDVTQLNGYCTIFNCEPGGCPDEAVCVVFNSQESTVPECADASRLSRFQRSFCMATCDSNDDCRSGYTCTNLRRPDNPWSAIVVDPGPGRVCLETPRTTRRIDELDPPRSGEVCAPPPPEAEGMGGAGGD